MKIKVVIIGGIVLLVKYLLPQKLPKYLISKMLSLFKWIINNDEIVDINNKIISDYIIIGNYFSFFHSF